MIRRNSSLKFENRVRIPLEKSVSSTNRNNTKREICVTGRIYAVIQDPCQCRGLKEKQLINRREQKSVVCVL